MQVISYVETQSSLAYVYLYDTCLVACRSCKEEWESSSVNHMRIISSEVKKFIFSFFVFPPFGYHAVASITYDV